MNSSDHQRDKLKLSSAQAQSDTPIDENVQNTNTANKHESWSEEKQLRLLSTALESAANAVTITNQDGVIEWVNPAFCELTGYTADEVIGQTPRILKSGHQDAQLYTELWNTIKSGRVWHGEVINQKKDGTLYTEIKTITPAYNQNNEITHFIDIKQDISLYRETERALQSTEKRYRTIFETAGGLICAINRDSLIVDCNKRSIQFFGLQPQEILNHSIFEYVHIDYQSRLRHHFEEVRMHGALATCEFQLLVKSNKILDVVTHSSSLQDDNGAFQEIICIINDISDQKIAELNQRELAAHSARVQRLESLGVLAGGIAHDFNNMLTGILGYSELALSESENDRISGYLKEVMQAGNRAKELVHQILTFSRQTQQEARPVMAHLPVKEALKLVTSSLPSTITVKRYIDSQCGSIVADPMHLHQIVLNLCTNAYHAMLNGGGILTVTLLTERVDEDFARRNPPLVQGTYVVLKVSDTGKGMDDATKNRIFEPFFTTKPVGEGTGMGLSTVHGIVTALGGIVQVESTLGEGSTFTVYLPQIMDFNDNVDLAIDLIPSGEERILFVDDLEPLTRMGKVMLERLGYVVTPMNNSQEALELFSSDTSAFDLVITDLTMPNLIGTQLAAAILEIRPNIPIILISGFLETMATSDWKSIGIREFATKPLSLQELGSLVRRVLDEDLQLRTHTSE